MGLEKIEHLEYISHIDNNGRFEDYYNIFYNTFLKDFVFDENLNYLEYLNVIPKNLEDAILLTLAKDFKSTNQTYYTTTEISHKINQTFSNVIKEKHKDNISRYFNQRFYPYYEIKNIDDKIKYKLSPTGYSKAISLYKMIFHPEN
jgi:hypothetical protein